ncbi:DUF4332 domain-containing protein [Roseimaritima ulvae]|uniref:DUF4332 domain-containing protein n=1 Tax=Roseimaritima ulvae TaxID=980254 RepID=A0A5B9QLQ0_9BACT|nr:DUF4332 domain-containing protein [Roseimaritima ulvae]QEG39997.1 hypothetical protein UC8_20010 [Roseimaritima ulvae]
MLQRMARYWQRSKPADTPPAPNRLPDTGVQPERQELRRMPAAAASSADTIVFKRMPVPAESLGEAPAEAETLVPPAGVRRKRPLASITLKQLGILDAATRSELEARGVRDAAAFIALPTDSLSPQMSAARLNRLQHAVRMAHTITGMRPWHALLLFAIHRRSPNKLAGESAGTLYRDIKRFAWSSRGQRFLAGRAQPTAEQVQSWIASARARRQRSAA